MNSLSLFNRTLLSLSLASVFLTGCVTAPKSPDAAINARQQLTALQTNPQLAVLAPQAIKDAEQAVLVAEQPEKNTVLSAHRVVMAERKVSLASTVAQTRQLEQQRDALSQKRDDVRLNARTREANIARDDAQHARFQATNARADANSARDEAQNARLQASSAQADANAARDDARLARERAGSAAALTADLRQQIAELNARPTDRGLVVTLGDVLFDSGTASLKNGASGHLDKLALFLNAYPMRTAKIEGHTDNVGSASSNVLLSQRRADTVRAFLMAQGVAGKRLEASGKGEDLPVSSNVSADGRQQNRRVEVIIANVNQ